MTLLRFLSVTLGTRVIYSCSTNWWCSHPPTHLLFIPCKDIVTSACLVNNFCFRLMIYIKKVSQFDCNYNYRLIFKAIKCFKNNILTIILQITAWNCYLLCVAKSTDLSTTKLCYGIFFWSKNSQQSLISQKQYNSELIYKIKASDY